MTLNDPTTFTFNTNLSASGVDEGSKIDYEGVPMPALLITTLRWPNLATQSSIAYLTLSSSVISKVINTHYEFPNYSTNFSPPAYLSLR